MSVDECRRREIPKTIQIDCFRNDTYIKGANNEMTADRVEEEHGRTQIG